MIFGTTPLNVLQLSIHCCLIMLEQCILLGLRAFGVSNFINLVII